MVGLYTIILMGGNSVKNCPLSCFYVLKCATAGNQGLKTIPSVFIKRADMYAATTSLLLSISLYTLYL